MKDVRNSRILGEMRGLVLVGCLAAAAAHGAAAETRAVALPRATTLATVPGYVEGFAQDGDRIVWATESGRCGRNVVLRTLSTGQSTFLDARNGPMCEMLQYAGEVQPWMALAGTRALWARTSGSLSVWNSSVFTAAPQDRGEHQVGGSSRGRDPSDEHDGLRPVPMSGQGKTLVFADISDVGGEDAHGPSGVYRVIGKRAQHVRGTEGAFAVAVSGSRFALGRRTPPGCVCNSMPAWSPDGERIAFVSIGAGLFVVNSDGTRFRRVTDEARYFAWAPNGASFAVAQEGALVVLNGDGGRTRKIGPSPSDPVSGASGAPPFAWSPDGTHLAYRASTNGHVLVVPATGGLLVDLGESSDIETPQWSPDSRRIAFVRRVGEQDHVFVAAASGGGRIDLGAGAQPAWAPDGSAIALIREEGIYVAAPDGSRISQIAPGTFDFMEWSPDARWVAYSAADKGLWIRHPDGAAPRKLGEGTYGIYWSPDSRAIADSRTVIEVDTGLQRVLPRELNCDPPRWSPDSARVVCVAPSDFGYEGELAIVDAPTGTTSIVTHTTPEPQRMVVEARTHDGALLSSYEAPEKLVGAALAGSRYALLIARSQTESTIEIRTSNGKSVRRVNVPRPWFDQFSMSRTWIVFRAGKTVRVLNAATGKTTVLARTKDASIVGLSIDGRRVAWAESTSKRSRIRAVVLPR
jgi:hypothetical protein